MSSNREVDSLLGSRVVVGLSTITGVTLSAGQHNIILRHVAGNSLEIGGASLTWGAGYLMLATEQLSFQCNGTFYLAATGATVTLAVLKGVTSGN